MITIALSTILFYNRKLCRKNVLNSISWQKLLWEVSNIFAIHIIKSCMKWNGQPATHQIFSLQNFWPSIFSVVYLCFFYLDPLQNDAIMTSQCMQYIFWEILNSMMRVSYLWPKKKGKERGNELLAPGWKMAKQTLVRKTYYFFLAYFMYLYSNLTAQSFPFTFYCSI